MSGYFYQIAFNLPNEPQSRVEELKKYINDQTQLHLRYIYCSRVENNNIIKIHGKQHSNGKIFELQILPLDTIY